MYDGTTRKFTKVRDVPDLRNYLITLGVLDCVGYRCRVQGGVMMVMKGILVAMEAKMFWNLYSLEGRRETNHGIVAYEGASDSTHLWH